MDANKVPVNGAYLEPAFRPMSYKNTFDKIIKFLRTIENDFDAIAFTGMSGAMFGPAVAAQMNKAVIMTRKNTDKSHSPYTIEGATDHAYRYVILDDLICSGSTVKDIFTKIQNDKYICASTLIGVVLWNQYPLTEESRSYYVNNCFQKANIFIKGLGKDQHIPLY